MVFNRLTNRTSDGGWKMNTWASWRKKGRKEGGRKGGREEGRKGGGRNKEMRKYKSE